MIRAGRKNHTEKILLTEKQIRHRVKSLAASISKDYADKELTLVGVLKGSVIFFADLLRHLSVDCSIDFVSISSYKGTASSGVVRILTDLRESPVGKNLLLVEDIVDSGFTLDYLRKNLLTRKPASVRTCVLLDKTDARKRPVEVDYRGFVIPEKFVVGYGLDYEEKYRGLPYIGVLNHDSI